jgi:di/tricarboxylate transporter
MSFDVVVTLLVVLGTVIALVREVLAPSLVVSGAMVLLLLSGVVTPKEALAGFSNPALMTVAALFILARAVEKTGALQPILARALKAGSSDRGNLARLLAPVAGASAFLNNTPIVAMLIGPVQAWADQRGRSASRYLMPISFATMLGGMVTLIGTSTNLVVSGLLVNTGQKGFGIFEFSWIGLPVAIVGLAFLAIASPVMLPDRKGIRRQFEDERREFTIEMDVEPAGAAEGRTVAEVGLRHLEGVFLAWIRRGDALVTPVSPDETLRAGDRLGFVGSVERVVDLQSIRGIRAAAAKHAGGIEDGAHGYFEVVVAAISPLVGETLKSADFRERYHGSVLAIHRSGRRIEGKLGDVEIEAGDTLLVLSDRSFRNKWRDRRDFLLVSQLAGSTPVSGKKAALVLGLAVAVIGLSALEIVPILNGALAAAIILVLAKVLTPNEARSAVDLDTLITIASSFAIGAAIESSGLASMVASLIVGPVSSFGPIAVLAAIVFATMALTELITNNAAAVLIFPIAMAAAAQAGVDARGFALAVALAASASFLTPIGYQTNTMIYGAGGYRFSDFARLGFPLTITVFFSIVFLTAWRHGFL